MASVKLHKLSGQTAMITPVHDADRTAEGTLITKEVFASKYLLKKVAPIAWGDHVPVPFLNNKRLQLLVARKHGESQLPMDAFERVPDSNRFAGFCDFCWFNSTLSRRTPTHRLVAEGMLIVPDKRLSYAHHDKKAWRCCSRQKCPWDFPRMGDWSASIPAVKSAPCVPHLTRTCCRPTL